MRRVLGFGGIALFISIFVAGFFAYFVRSFDPAARIWYDGLGRSLQETPWIIRFVFRADHDWPGWQWFFADFAVFWIGVFIAYKLVDFGFQFSSTPGQPVNRD